MNNFLTLTPEQRAIALEKAREASALKRKQREENKHNLKLEYKDASHWAELASKYKIRMPNAEEQVDVSCIRKYLKRAGLSTDTWNDHYTSMTYFVKNNPKWTKYAAAGLVLELKDAEMTQ